MLPFLDCGAETEYPRAMNLLANGLLRTPMNMRCFQLHSGMSTSETTKLWFALTIHCSTYQHADGFDADTRSSAACSAVEGCEG